MTLPARSTEKRTTTSPVDVAQASHGRPDRTAALHQVGDVFAQNHVGHRGDSLLLRREAPGGREGRRYPPRGAAAGPEGAGTGVRARLARPGTRPRGAAPRAPRARGAAGRGRRSSGGGRGGGGRRRRGSRMSRPGSVAFRVSAGGGPGAQSALTVNDEGRRSFRHHEAPGLHRAQQGFARPQDCPRPPQPRGPLPGNRGRT